jgi:very-short-patch-repair endonuclease
VPDSHLLHRARDLRRRQTDSEGRLWGELRGRRLGGWKWKRQVPRGRYIVDFLCAELGLVLELDGSQHQDNLAYDERRTRFLQSQGLRVLRFPSDRVFGGLDYLCEAILAACGGDRSPPAAAASPTARPPSPSEPLRVSATSPRKRGEG